MISRTLKSSRAMKEASNTTQRGVASATTPCSRWEYLVDPTPETATHCLRIDRIEIDRIPLPIDINCDSIPRKGHIYFRENADVMAPGSAVPDSESTNQDGR